MHTIFLAHAATGSHRRLVALGVAVTTVAVMAGVSLAERRVPAGPAGAPDAALATAADRHHSPLAESAPSITIDGIDAAEPPIKSAE